jgi:uncharacterized membrane protein
MTIQVTRSIIVKGTPDDLYPLWANFENIPQFNQHILSVVNKDDNMSHFTMKNPLGDILEWDAEMTCQQENKRIGWNSRDDGDIKTTGQITFNPLPQGQTEVTVTLNYMPPKDVRSQIAELFHSLDNEVGVELRNFKAYAEK